MVSSAGLKRGTPKFFFEPLYLLICFTIIVTWLIHGNKNTHALFYIVQKHQEIKHSNIPYLSTSKQWINSNVHDWYQVLQS